LFGVYNGQTLSGAHGHCLFALLPMHFLYHCLLLCFFSTLTLLNIKKANKYALLATLGTLVIVDASGEALKHALQEGVFLIKPNIREFRELVGLEIKTSNK
jgi:hypothetical protein